MKKAAMLAAATMLLLALAACAPAVPETIELETMDGQTESVSTQGMSDNQIEALQAVASGESNMMTLMQSGLFTSEEMADMGLGGAGRGIQGGPMNMDLDMDALDLTGLTDEQIAYIEDIAAGEKTPQQAVRDGVLTMQEMQDIGLMGMRPEGGRPEGAGPPEGGQRGQGGK